MNEPNAQSGRLYPLLLTVCLLITGCILSPGKEKKEPEPPGAPAVTSMSISDGDTVRTRDLTVTWKGNLSAKSYRFTLDAVSSDWFDSTSVRLTGLAEGGHILAVQARSDSLLGEPVTVRFTVDVEKGASIRFNPDTVSVTSSVILMFEEVRGLMAAHIEIASTDSSARMREFVPSDAVAFGGYVVFSDDRNPYRLVIDIGFTGIRAGFSGSLEVGSFLVSPLKSGGLIAVDPNASLFRDTRNIPMTFERFETVRIER
jgi:hypothetical protein